MFNYNKGLSLKDCLGTDKVDRLYHAKYTGAGAAAAANSTAANAGIIQLAQGATVKMVKLYEWEFSPAANSENSNYGLWLQRATTKGTWTTTVTPAALDGMNALASNSTVYAASTVAGSLVSNSVLLQVGCNQAAGYRWVAVPGGEINLGVTTLYNIFLAYSFVQGTAVNNGSFSYDE